MRSSRPRFTLSRTIVLIVLGILLVLPLAVSSQGHQQQPPLGERYQTLQELLGTIQRYYVDDVSDEMSAVREETMEEINKRIEAGIADALSRLDIHSRLYTKEEYKEFAERYRGKYQGIGVRFRIIRGALTITDVLPGSSLESKNIQPGDVITRINTEPAIPITQEEAFERLRGPQGSTVTITVRSRDASTTRDIAVVRNEIDIPTVTLATMLSDTTGYVRLGVFSRNAEGQLTEAINDLLARGMKRLLLDLRGNGGGLLTQATAISDLLLPAGSDPQGRLIWRMEGRATGTNREGYGQNPSLLPDTMPLIVLTNGQTASASEIVAGALQDWDRALIVGSKTFGKALVQNQIRLTDGSMLFLTIARYTTPTGRSIQIPRDEDRKPIQPPSSSGHGAAATGQTFRTLRKQRIVTESGGITPDIRTTPRTFTNHLPRTLQSFRADEDEPVHLMLAFSFEYLESLFQTTQLEQMAIEEYLDRFRVTDGMLDDLASFVLGHPENPFPAVSDGGPGSAQELRALPSWQNAEDDIRLLLRADIAMALWGTPAFERVLLHNDPEVQEARNHFTEARDLLR